MTPVDQIQILMHEYDMLCGQLSQLEADQFQIYNIFAIGLAALVAIYYEGHLRLISFMLSFLVLGAILLFVWVFVDIRVAKVSARVREIETQVNAEAGRPLLQWETRQGLGGTVGKYFAHTTWKKPE